MSSHYLVDLFDSPLFPMLSRIIDVQQPSGGQSLANGCLVIRVPDYVPITRPTNLGDLLNQKYLGMLAYYAGFGNIDYDALLDSTGFDLVNSLKVRLGSLNTVALAPTGHLQSNVYALPWTGPPPGPTVAVITWEAFNYVDSDPKAARLVRTYQELASTVLQCTVSFDGGAHWNTVYDGGVFNIPPGQQGTNFLIHFVNPSGSDVFLGSWAVIY